MSNKDKYELSTKDKLVNFFKLNKIILLPLISMVVLVAVVLICFSKTDDPEIGSIIAINDPSTNNTTPDDQAPGVADETTDPNVTTDPNETTPATNTALPYMIRVNTKTNCVTIYTLDDDGDYTVPYKAMVCSTGKADISDNETPLGTFECYSYLGWCQMVDWTYGQFAYRFNGGILFHSTPIATELIFKKGSKPKYTALAKNRIEVDEFNKLGTAASLGCVRLCVRDASWIANNCELGTKVVVVAEDTDPLEKPKMIKISENIPSDCGGWVTYRKPADVSPANITNGEYKEVKILVAWDPTDPDPNNPWNNYSPKINCSNTITVKTGCSESDILTYNPTIKAYDTCGNDVTKQLQLKGTFSLDIAGTYNNISLTITDDLGRTTTKENITLVVNDNAAIPTTAPVSLGTVGTPLITTAADGEGVDITIKSNTSGATIYYTIDDSNPTTASKLYAGTFTLTSSKTIKAIAVKSGYTNSSVSTKSVTVETTAAPTTPAATTPAAIEVTDIVPHSETSDVVKYVASGAITNVYTLISAYEKPSNNKINVASIKFSLPADKNSGISSETTIDSSGNLHVSSDEALTKIFVRYSYGTHNIDVEFAVLH